MKKEGRRAGGPLGAYCAMHSQAITTAVWLGACLLVVAVAPVLGEPPRDASPSVTESQPALGTDSTQQEVEPTTATQPASAPAPFLDVIHNERLTGDWGGLRRDLEQHGFSLESQLTTVYQHAVHGGLNTRNAHDVYGRADQLLTLDFEQAGLWRGGELFTWVESGWNEGVDEHVGSLMGTTGVALYDEEARVRELWYEQRFLGNKARLKLGKYDIAVDIDANAFANYEITQFMHPALVNTANLPIPDFGFGAVFSIYPAEWMYFTLATTDAQADGRETGLNTAFHDEDYFFSAAELGFTPIWRTRWGCLPGGYRFIVWYDPQPKAIFIDDRDGRRRSFPLKRDDTGFAFNMDQLVLREVPDQDDDSQGLGVFFRYGYAEEDVNEIEHFWSLGAQYQGLLPGRDADVLAFGMAQSIISDQLHALDGRDRETAYELYYAIQALPWLTITPDLQYISNPGGGRDGRDALVAGIRVRMVF